MSFGFSVSDCIEIVRFARDICKKFKDSSDQFKAIRNEVAGLYIVLEDVAQTMSERELSEKQRSDLYSLMQGCRNVLKDLDMILDKYKDLGASSQNLKARSQRAWNKVRWDQDQITELRHCIVSNMAILDAFNTSLTSQQVQATKDSVAGLNERFEGIQLSQEQKKREAVIDWLSPHESWTRQGEIFDSHQEGTGQWLLDSDEFRDWLSGNGTTLWCPGIPGAGKTVLASIVVNHLRGKFKYETDIGIACIYCNYKERDLLTPVNLIASVWSQIIQQHGPLSHDVQGLYETHSRHRTRPRLNEVSEILKSEAGRYSKVFIVVDALDECPEGKGSRESLLRELKALQPIVSLMVTSRFIDTIAREFQRAIQLEISANVEDICAYVRGRISREVKLSRNVVKDPVLGEGIVKTVSGNAQKMFLLAQLHMDSLATKGTCKAVWKALGTLPQGLDDTYDEAMERIERQNEDDRELAKRVLYWICYALRPLTLKELQHALAVELGESELDQDNLPYEEDLTSLCAGLVVVNQESDTIGFVHYTTQEYFERIRADGFPDAQSTIAMTCLTYLSFDVFGRGPCLSGRELNNRLQENAFLRYAAQYWGVHARGEPEKKAAESILKFLKQDSKVSGAVQVMRVPDDAYLKYVRISPKAVQGLWVAATFGLGDIVKLLVKNGANLDAKTGGGETALYAAAKNGHEAVLRLLLENGADFNAKTGEGETALYAAAKNGHEAVLRLLLENGADFNTKTGTGHTTVYAAAENGREGAVRLLLDQGADINAKANEEWTALLIAAAWGHKTVVQLLLERGVDVSAQDEGRPTALHQAVVNGSEAVVPLLLDAGADMDARWWNGKTVLHTALYGSEEVSLLLLERGANIHKIDDQNQTALHHAAILGRQLTGRWLIKKGAILGAQDYMGRTALQAAARVDGREAMLQLLIDEGVDINPRDYEVRTALHEAASRANEGNVRVLVENGACIEVRDCEGRTALHAATTGFGGSEKVVGLLRARGADINTQDDKGLTPLHIAAQCGNYAMVQLLLRTGADISARDMHGWTALHMAAAHHGEVDVMQLLLESGANVAVREESGRTALHLAAFGGKKAALETVLKNGIDISELDGEGRTALHHAMEWKRADVERWQENGSTALHRAAMNGDTVVVQLLLDRGIQTRLTDFEGRTALHWAATKGTEEVTRILLRNGAQVNGRDRRGQTALSDAVVNKDKDAVVQLLLQEGADVGAGDNWGRTALRTAVRKGGAAAVRLLLESGADALVCDIDGRTVLDEADGVLEGVEAVIKLVRGVGADVSSWSNQEQVALSDALGAGKVATVRLLLKQGLDSSVRDYKGRTALDDSLGMLKGVEVVAWHVREKMAGVKSEGGEESLVRHKVDLLQKRIEAIRRAGEGTKAGSAVELSQG